MKQSDTHKMSRTLFERITRHCRGAVFIFLVFSSTYLGMLFLMTPFLPVIVISPRICRAYVDTLIWLWKIYFVAFYETLFQTKVRFYGDIPPRKAGLLLMMNHRTRFDWLYLFSYQVRFASVRRYTISLKRMLKFLPGIGWAMQLAGYIFLDRKWEEDQEMITRGLNLFRKINYKPQVLLFPEGTDLTKNTKSRSDKFADQNGLPKYNFVLHPRTTGFIHFVQEMKKGDMMEYLLDVTIAYPGTIPQSEFDILKGNFPSEIHFHIKSYKNNEIPTSKSDLDIWCKQRWQQKEDILKQFYEKKSFGGSDTEVYFNDTTLLMGQYVLVCILWTVFQWWAVWLIWMYPLLWLYIVPCTVTYCLLSAYTSGLGLLMASAFNV